MRVRPLHLALLAALIAILAWSAIRPHDYLTWWMEVAPVFIGLAILLPTYRRFRFTDMAYLLILFHMTILIIGGHYTYERMPAFNWIRDHWHLARNYYDRLGHLTQGFVPAILAREVLLRTSPLRPGKWLFTIVVCFCLALSACYEFVEWGAAVALHDAANSFLGTQGDVWDTQWDMFCALWGSILALVLLSRAHDRELAKLVEEKA